MSGSFDRDAAEARFKRVFDQFGLVSAYAKRRGCPDADAIAAEVMAIAWRRLADVPADDPRPWLLGVARNLAFADWRRRSTTRRAEARSEPDASTEPSVLAGELDSTLSRALLSLSSSDREALLLVAWEDLTPAQAAASLGITATAFRARLHRARRRCQAALDRAEPAAGRVPPSYPCKPAPMEEA
jgi:RNA polymerase sigma-70 factor (ECF subfamily)